MERVVEWVALLGLRCGGGKVQKTSRDSKETILDHKRFSIDAVSSRKSSGTTKSKNNLTYLGIPHGTPKASGGWR